VSSVSDSMPVVYAVLPPVGMALVWWTPGTSAFARTVAAQYRRDFGAGWLEVIR
jgi:hypothetical protein